MLILSLSWNGRHRHASRRVSREVSRFLLFNILRIWLSKFHSGEKFSQSSSARYNSSCCSLQVIFQCKFKFCFADYSKQYQFCIMLIVRPIRKLYSRNQHPASNKILIYWILRPTALCTERVTNEIYSQIIFLELKKCVNCELVELRLNKLHPTTNTSLDFDPESLDF